jgi:hypothetical protein
MAYLDVDIDVDDFMDQCSKKEIKEVIEWLKNNDYLVNEEILEEVETPRCYTGEKFEESLLKLRGHSTSLSIEEEEYVIKLADRIP